MIRKIIHIDEEKCNGCGKCANACHEGAIDIIDGKARLSREHFCDGLGDCLPNCPMGAITFEEREAPAYDESAVKLAKISKISRSIKNWPVELKLAPIEAPYFNDADLLIAADCSAFVCREFHEKYKKGKVLLIACPKLDGVDYSEKLGEIFAANSIKSVTILRMTVPCCGGLNFAVEKALKAADKNIPVNVIVLDTDGQEAD